MGRLTGWDTRLVYAGKSLLPMSACRSNVASDAIDGGTVDSQSERYALAVKVTAQITTRGALTVSMVALAAERAGVDAASWFPLLSGA